MNSQAVKDLLDKLTERLANEGFINPQQAAASHFRPPNTSARGPARPAARNASPEARFRNY